MGRLKTRPGAAAVWPATLVIPTQGLQTIGDDHSHGFTQLALVKSVGVPMHPVSRPEEHQQGPKNWCQQRTAGQKHYRLGASPGAWTRRFVEQRLLAAHSCASAPPRPPCHSLPAQTR